MKTLPIFRLLSTAYIELVRGVPLITWLLISFLMLPVALPEGIEIGGVLRAIGAMTFFSAAYLAENVRGGLQSIPGGQREASRALGMSTIQMIVFITLPQALRAVIPALVGQVIALFKDTSLVAIIGLFVFGIILGADQSVPTGAEGLQSFTLYLISALVIWNIFSITSTDVMHSFSVPVFRLKQDAIPGRIITGWFEATEAQDIRTATPSARLLAGLTHTWVLDDPGWQALLVTVANSASSIKLSTSSSCAPKRRA